MLAAFRFSHFILQHIQPGCYSTFIRDCRMLIPAHFPARSGQAPWCAHSKQYPTLGTFPRCSPICPPSGTLSLRLIFVMRLLVSHPLRPAFTHTRQRLRMETLSFLHSRLRALIQNEPNLSHTNNRRPTKWQQHQRQTRAYTRTRAQYSPTTKGRHICRAPPPCTICLILHDMKLYKFCHHLI